MEHATMVKTERMGRKTREGEPAGVFEVVYQCGGCNLSVGAKDKFCRHCGAMFDLGIQGDINGD